MGNIYEKVIMWAGDDEWMMKFEWPYIEVSGGRNELFWHARLEKKEPIKCIKIIPFNLRQVSFIQSRENMLFSKTKKLVNKFYSKLCLHYIYLD